MFVFIMMFRNRYQMSRGMQMMGIELLLIVYRLQMLGYKSPIHAVVVPLVHRCLAVCVV